MRIVYDKIAIERISFLIQNNLQPSYYESNVTGYTTILETPCIESP